MDACQGGVTLVVWLQVGLKTQTLSGVGREDCGAVLCLPQPTRPVTPPPQHTYLFTTNALTTPPPLTTQNRQSQLGPRSFAALNSSAKLRALVQTMTASDVAVMIMEDQKLGLPRFSGLVRGLDFQQTFAAQQTLAAQPAGVG